MDQTFTDPPQLSLIRRYFQAIEHDADEPELAAFFASDVRQREFPNRLVDKGAERDLPLLLAGNRRGREVVRDQRYEIRSAIAAGDRVAVELTWTGTLKVPLAGTPAGGMLKAHCGVFFRVLDGRIAEQHNYDCFEPL
jgi:ketosteroid isomerase-like protein